MITVRKVESGSVKTSVDQFLQLLDFPAGRSKGAKDLGGTLFGVRLVEDHGNIDVSTGKIRSVSLHLDCFVFVSKEEEKKMWRFL
jgi:hypothetical protein